MESVRQTRQPRRDLRVLGGLVAALAIGVTAGYLSAALTSQSSSKAVSRGPVASVTAPSASVYGDRDSRLPVTTSSSIAVGATWGDHDSRLPYLTGSNAALTQGIKARVTALQGLAGIDWSNVPGAASADHDSRPPVAPFIGR